MQPLKIPSGNTQSALLGQFQSFFTDFTEADLAAMGLLYDQSITFDDPVHRLAGSPELPRYFQQLQQRLPNCRFSLDKEIVAGCTAVLCWTMSHARRSLNNGKFRTLPGISYLEFGHGPSQHLVTHRDWYENGQMLSERNPLIGRVLAMVKSGLSRPV